ncbi:MAG: DEAD/DEAH box helicase, partial [Phycisphaerae bacterium]
KLKQICNHPAHFLPDQSPLPGRSGKCARLIEMLEVVLAEDDQALVFTQFKKMGDLLKKQLEEALDREVLFLHGGTPRKTRDQLVSRFQTGGGTAPVFLLSLKAGGYGLNLTAAGHVFHFDRWWNPAVEDQATDRAHRIGQAKHLQVHKFICIGTLEERIDGLLEQKRHLADNILGSGEQWLTELSTDKLREVFALSQDAVAEAGAETHAAEAEPPADDSIVIGAAGGKALAATGPSAHDGNDNGTRLE